MVLSLLAGLRRFADPTSTSVHEDGFGRLSGVDPGEDHFGTACDVGIGSHHKAGHVQIATKIQCDCGIRIGKLLLEVCFTHMHGCGAFIYHH